MIPTTRTPEYVWDLLYSNSTRGKVLNAVDFYYKHIYCNQISDRLTKALMRTWIKAYGIRDVNKAKAIIAKL